nr:hypothetical protein [Rhodococcus opacus]
MRTINKADWTPTPLVSPAGRLYTPSSYVEHKQLVASGYRPAPEPVPAEPESAPAPTVPTVPTVPTAPPVSEAAPVESSEKPTDDEAADAPKTKITRRTTGGAQ